jgi:outer membrane immunogenic protein
VNPFRGRALAAALAASLAASPAVAQNTPVFDWSGFYLGAGAGYAWGGVNHSFAPFGGGFGPPGMWARDDIGGTFSNSASFGLYGGHAGYMQQWDRLVGGIEASFDLSDMNATTNNAFGDLLPNTVYNTRLKWLATITPRLGYAWNQFQFYGKAGVAIGRVASTLSADGNACFNNGCSFNAEATHVGYTVGAGLAYAFTPNWIVGLEYDYTDLGSENYGGQTIPSTTWNTAYALQPRFSTLRGRVSYKFGGPQASADQAASTAAPGEPPPRWQGFYLGANAGYGWANFGHRFDPGASGNGGSGPASGLFAPDAMGGYFTSSGTGGLYGLHAGYNQQWDRLVGGIELSAALTDIRAQTTNPFGAQTDPNATYTTNIRWLATLAPRVGLAWEQFLVFGKAGVAAARLSSQLNSTSALGCLAGGFGGIAGPCSFTEERNHIGVVVGAGVEYQLTPSWVLGVEYNYLDLSTENYGGTIQPSTSWPLSYTVHPQIHLLKGRLSYRL